jgi:hypothetical protein
MADRPVEDASVEKVWEKLIKRIQTFSDTRIGVLRGARQTPVLRRNETTWKSIEAERSRPRQLNDGKWIVCAQDSNGVMVVARPGWHYMTEEDGIEDVERLIDQSL